MGFKISVTDKSPDSEISAVWDDYFSDISRKAIKPDSVKTNFKKRFKTETPWFGWFALVLLVAGVVLALLGVIYWSTAVHAFIGTGLTLGIGTVIAAVDSIDSRADTDNIGTSKKSAE